MLSKITILPMRRRPASGSVNAKRTVCSSEEEAVVHQQVLLRTIQHLRTTTTVGCSTGERVVLVLPCSKVLGQSSHKLCSPHRRPRLR